MHGINVKEKLAFSQAMNLIVSLIVRVCRDEVEKHVAPMDDDKCFRYRFSGLVAHGALDDETAFLSESNISAIGGSCLVKGDRLGVISRKSPRIVNRRIGIAFSGRFPIDCHDVNRLIIEAVYGIGTVFPSDKRVPTLDRKSTRLHS